MNRKELTEKYLQFFEAKGHTKIKNSSLIPENDPTVLFTTAGMHPLVPYLLGQPHPDGKKLVGVQKCIRTGDIEEVGDTTHHTFFEMLGNWSLGSYWKKETIEMSYEFLTKTLGISKDRLAISVFGGDEEVPKDSESREIWEKLGISRSRVINLAKEHNWWGPAGKTGPCGTDTEMFYWKNNEILAPAEFDPNDENWVEIWNDVLMGYIKDEQGRYIEAKQKNIDTGMGVERTVAVLNGLEDNYLADMWKPIIGVIEELSRKNYGEEEKITRAMRIIADHIKAAVFMISDGVVPGNSEQGYVLRRLIRRAVRFGRTLDMEHFVVKVAESVFEIYRDYKLDKEKICMELEKEEENFLKTLEKGMNLFSKVIKRSGGQIPGKEAFLLYQSYGFPIEMTKELADEQGVKIDMKGFEEELARHSELSKTASKGKFASGLADHSEATTRLHTATHLLLAALNKLLKREDEKDIEQRGSNITAERARFDFSFERKLTEEEVKKIEDMVNSWMKTGDEVTRKEMDLTKAKELGAAGIFEDKYAASDKVSVYVIGDGSISKELCTGPHVSSMKEFEGLIFKITKQKSVGSGVRRIKVELLEE